MRGLKFPAAFLAGLVFLLLFMSGCLESDNNVQNNGTPTGRTVLVNYKVSGGIVGYNDQLTIYTDGLAELQRKNSEREFTLDSSQLADLKELLDKANFPDLKDEYLNVNGGADLITYSITYQISGVKYTVTAEDGVVPDKLQPVFAELNQLISSKG